MGGTPIVFVFLHAVLGISSNTGHWVVSSNNIEVKRGKKKIVVCNLCKFLGKRFPGKCLSEDEFLHFHFYI
jgi:hypothetical protein